MKTWDAKVTAFENMFGRAQYLTPTDLSHWLRVSKKTIRRRIQDGTITTSKCKLDNKDRISRSTALNLIEEV